MDKKCLTDNINEFKNQFKFAPCVPKVFEVDPTGTVGLFERVVPIRSREEFLMIAEDVFDMLISKFIGKYVLDDIGTKAFMNYGYREGFGPVLLDFPYAYELDGDKLICSKVTRGHICNGVIDYDEGFNKLVCEKCGAEYTATELQAKIKEKEIEIIKPKGDMDMVIEFRRGSEVIGNVDTSGEYSTFKKVKRKGATKKKEKGYSDGETFEIIFNNNRNEEPEEEPEVVKPKEEKVNDYKYRSYRQSQKDTDTQVQVHQNKNVEVIKEEDVEVENDPFAGWSEEEINVYHEAKASLGAVGNGVKLTQKGYQKLLAMKAAYPEVFNSLLIELGINEIPNPEVVESTAKEVDVESDNKSDIPVKEEKTPLQIAREYKESIKSKPNLVISPRQYHAEKESEVSKFIDKDIDVEDLF